MLYNARMPDEPPPLKTDPKHGYYPWWPEDGDDWVHPEDVAAARRMIPSTRIWRRDGAAGRQGEYVVMHYGETRLRVRRTLWREAPYEGLDLGDWVEVRPRGLTNEPHTAGSATCGGTSTPARSTTGCCWPMERR